MVLPSGSALGVCLLQHPGQAHVQIHQEAGLGEVLGRTEAELLELAEALLRHGNLLAHLHDGAGHIVPCGIPVAAVLALAVLRNHIRVVDVQTQRGQEFLHSGGQCLHGLQEVTAVSLVVSLHLDLSSTCQSACKDRGSSMGWVVI